MQTSNSTVPWVSDSSGKVRRWPHPPKRRFPWAVWFWLACAPAYALYLLLKPSPRADEIRLLPLLWLRWLDEMYDFRTLILTLIVCLPVAWWLRHVEFNQARRRILWGLLALLCAAEVAQLWIPKRVFDWDDIAYTILGVGLAESLVVAMKPMGSRAREGEVPPEP